MKNGLAENFVRTLKSAIISFSPTTFVELDRGIDNFLMQYIPFTGRSPAILLKSRSLRTSLDCAKTADVTFFKGSDLRPATGIVLSSNGKRMVTNLDLDDLSCHRRHIYQVEFITKDQSVNVTPDQTTIILRVSKLVGAPSPSVASAFWPCGCGAAKRKHWLLNAIILIIIGSDVKIQMRPTCVEGVVVTRSPRMSDDRGSNPSTATGYALLMSSNKSETRVQCFSLVWTHRNNYARTGGRQFKREWCEYEQNTYSAKPQIIGLFISL
ncbi:hypothetical protein CSKR_103644 [Clonorchis sinensis]|uniref:Uncharacterized protein n=1 Tax=Clonorchis sinensis TaxID=79923 RepID=A0A3R7EQ96_CLOSI|nr:hypothetical protein CSKR_103644 [Clonorchis sinensis]